MDRGASECEKLHVYEKLRVCEKLHVCDCPRVSSFQIEKGINVRSLNRGIREQDAVESEEDEDVAGEVAEKSAVVSFLLLL